MRSKTGEPPEAHYLAPLHKLGEQPGMLGAIFFKAQNKIQDPACGTGGFFLVANEWLSGTGKWIKDNAEWLGYNAPRLNAAQKTFLRESTFQCNEIVPGTRRLCLMNLFLHNIGGLLGEPSVERADALTYERQDFWETTSNKQLNFLQHIVNMLSVDGKAAVLPPTISALRIFPVHFKQGIRCQTACRNDDANQNSLSLHVQHKAT